MIQSQYSPRIAIGAALILLVAFAGQSRGQATVYVDPFSTIDSEPGYWVPYPTPLESLAAPDPNANGNVLYAPDAPTAYPGPITYGYSNGIYVPGPYENGTIYQSYSSYGYGGYGYGYGYGNYYGGYSPGFYRGGYGGYYGRGNGYRGGRGGVNVIVRGGGGVVVRAGTANGGGHGGHR